jgi:hypothetical protein
MNIPRRMRGGSFGPAFYAYPVHTETSRVMAGHSRPKDGVASLAY